MLSLSKHEAVPKAAKAPSDGAVAAGRGAP